MRGDGEAKPESEVDVETKAEVEAKGMRRKGQVRVLLSTRPTSQEKSDCDGRSDLWVQGLELGVGNDLVVGV